MSDTGAVREPDASLGGAAVDQGARGQQQIDREDDAVLTPDEVVENLRRQLEELEGQGAEKDKALEAERRRAADAERARQDAEARARQADEQARATTAQSQRSTAEAQLDAVSNALESHNAHMTSLEATYAAALAEGEFQNAAKIQKEMSILGGKIVSLENGKAALEERVKNPPPEDPGRQQQQQQPSDTDRRENFIRTQPAKVQDWLRGPNGDRFFTDRAFQSKVGAAAQAAQHLKGYAIDSQDYLDYIEEQVGLRQAPQSADAGRQQQTPQNRGRDVSDDRRMTTAPAGGATAGSVRRNADGSTEVYLTREEREMADRSGISHAEYARNKRDLMNENLIGPGARR